MKELVPSWLRDPKAYAQPTNLDMSTVALVALFNLWLGFFCVSVFEMCRRRWPHLYSPRKALGHATPEVMHSRGKALGAPLAWIRPLMALTDDDILTYGGYDVLIYLRFIAMATKIFASFAPYAFIVLLPVNASVFFKAEETTTTPLNTFNQLSMSSMPNKDPRMWAHCLGVYVLTGLTMHYLSRECQWYTRLRHRFLTQQDPRHRTVAVTQIPVEFRESQKLAQYFAKLYPGKVVGAVVGRKVDHLDQLQALRDTAKARLDRLQHRCSSAKLLLLNNDNSKKRWAWRRYVQFLEDAYDPTWWWSCMSEPERIKWHEAQLRRCDRQITVERQKHAPFLIARPTTEEPTGDAAVEPATPEPSRFKSYNAVEDTKREDFFDSARSVDGEYNDDSEDETPIRGFCRRLPCSRGHHPSEDDDDDLESSSLLPKKGEGLVEKASRNLSLLSLLGRRKLPPLELGSVSTQASLDTGFVTMNCFTGAAVATQVFHAATPGGMVATMAPEPKDVFWPNLATRTWRSKRTTRRVVANVIVALLLIFYIVPVTLISFILSEQAIEAKWPAVDELCQRSLVVSIVIKMLQPAGLIGLMLLLPPFFLGLGFWEGRTSWSSNTLAQLSRYYSFQITNVLLVTTVAGSLLKILQRILDHPKQTFDLLGQSLPQVCAFFSCYIFIKAFCGLPLELCRGIAFCQEIVKRLIYPSTTPGDRSFAVLGLRDMENPGWFSFGKFGAQDLLVVVLVMTYAVMAPVILVPGLLFFAFAQVVYRHQLLFVYEPLFESGGLLWPRIYRRTLFALFILQCTMTGLFFLKQCYKQGYAVLALSGATYAYKMHMKSMYSTSSSVAHHLPMELATAVDDAMRRDHQLRSCDHTTDTDDLRLLWNGLNDFIQPALRSSVSSWDRLEGYGNNGVVS